MIPLLPFCSSSSLITFSGTACLQTIASPYTLGRVDTIQDAHSLLHDLEVAAEQVELFMNASKSESMTVNIDHEEASILANYGDPLEHVHDFKYLGSFIADGNECLY